MRRSAAIRLLGSWVQIPPGAWISVSCECLCCQVEVSATGRSLVQRSPTDCAVCLRVWSSENKQPRHQLWVGRRGKDCDGTIFLSPSHYSRRKDVISVSWGCQLLWRYWRLQRSVGASRNTRFDINIYISARTVHLCVVCYSKNK
jgi:hypothetical protein